MIHHNINLITECCLHVQGMPGDAAEIGVYRGDSAALICGLLPKSTVYLFDTFAGTPREMLTEYDARWRVGEFNASVAEAEARLKDHHNYVLKPGLFPDSAADVECELKFVHIDCDLYKSTKAAIEWAWPRLIDGGLIVDDDYACPSCPGARKAIDEFRETTRRVATELRGTRIILWRQS